MAEIPIPPEPSSIENQQPLVQSSKRGVNKKIAALTLIIIIVSSMLGAAVFMYFSLNNQYNKLRSNYNSLQAQESALQIQHDELNSTYQALNQSYSVLEEKYGNLSDNYAALNQLYTGLSNSYSELSQAFNKPLSGETIPTISQLEQWLASDNTDTIPYTSPNFICGDFAVMLSQHAKLKHWDIGIVAVVGTTDTGQTFAHAFNAMITTEGLVYIEPQNDHLWWYNNYQSILEGTRFEIDNAGVYIQTYDVVIWYS